MVMNCNRLIFRAIEINTAVKKTDMGYWHQRADERHGNPPPLEVTRSY